ncbi:hypothetical protein PsorP6_016013 [Peronosclerospora sorghi]|uniref:Uncharacterized protein n=1 Tax=Peronosclerospora sorghi TaxID=230839 RepID=A0ACC0WPH7_9STRA|nr:hypothetical protein PsorP6_016013 [Peronosclerospora sorghi]
MKLTKSGATPLHDLNASIQSDDSAKARSNLRRHIVLLVGTLSMAGVVAYDVAMQTTMLSHIFKVHTLVGGSTCSPSIVNVSGIEYHSSHRYYSMLKALHPRTAPVFREKHTLLCDDSRRQDLKYDYCLPISGKKDSSLCAGADRMDLLAPDSSTTRCYASVLHMLLVEVYEELEAFGNAPIAVFGSLLGAVRNGSVIPYTEDADLAYSGKLDNETLGRALREKGYHFFFLNIWRVCVAPTHPLAARLYDPKLPLTTDYAVPYLDLYAMEKQDDTTWSMETLENKTLPNEKVQPFSQVRINELGFNTVADPEYFLTEMYGDSYMIPKPRK